MSAPIDFTSYDFAPVMNFPDDHRELHVFDFTQGYDPEFIPTQNWGIGRYNEKRANMYETPLFGGERNVHVGIDIWAEAGEPVFSFYVGEVLYMRDNDRPGDYGPTIIIAYELNDMLLYALYGHLSRESLQMVTIGEQVKKGQKIAELGDQDVNGGWVPHLHFQLSREDPGEADMPGVVAEEDREEALATYPDPRLILGDLY
jgi:murein DD-endopeptidase MepM/ murein hydrolase activator NlpD